jgi:hypothetical protein
MAVIGKTIAELGIAELVELVRCQIERYRRELAALPPPTPLERPSSFEEDQLTEEAAYRAVEAVYGPPRPKFPRARKPLSFEARARRADDRRRRFPRRLRRSEPSCIDELMV